MDDKDVKKVIEIIKENPLDDFWDDDESDESGDISNATLFVEIVKMVNKGGYDLVLKKK